MPDRPLNSPSTRLTPRLIRAKEAPGYIAMDRNRFNREARPHLTVIRIGVQGIAFDRLELDAFVDDYKSRNGRPGRLQGERQWDVEKHPDSSRERAFGTSTKGSKGKEFAKALERLTSQKPKGT